LIEAPSCLLLDVDGVLADLMGASCAAVNAQFGTSYTPDDVVAPADVADYSSLVFTTQEVTWLEWAWYGTNLLAELPVYPGALEGVASLGAEFAWVVVATSRERRGRPQTERWLAGVGLAYDALYVEPEAKRAALAGLSPRCRVLLIDDRPATWLLQDPRVRVVVPARPWNRMGALDRSHSCSRSES
jgi:hypothetical protein